MALTRRRVLLVDKDETVATITKFRLELLGYRVEHVASGDEAVAAVACERPDAIVLEMFMPGLDGFEVTSRLHNDERTSDIPIIAFSSDADLGHVQRAFQAGAKEFVVKPFDPIVLERKLEQLLAGKPALN